MIPVFELDRIRSGQAVQTENRSIRIVEDEISVPVDEAAFLVRNRSGLRIDKLKKNLVRGMGWNCCQCFRIFAVGRLERQPCLNAEGFRHSAQACVERSFEIAFDR